MGKSVDFLVAFLVDPGSKLNVSFYHRAGVTRLALHLVRGQFSHARAQCSGKVGFEKGYAGVP